MKLARYNRGPTQIHLLTESAYNRDRALCGHKPGYSSWHGRRVWAFEPLKEELTQDEYHGEPICLKCFGIYRKLVEKGRQ